MSTSAEIAKRRLLMVVSHDRRKDGRKDYNPYALLMFSFWDSLVFVPSPRFVGMPEILGKGFTKHD